MSSTSFDRAPFHATPRRSALAFLIGAATLLAVVSLSTLNAFADGGGVVILQRDTGPYHVRMDASTDQPAVGLWHLTFFVSNRQTGKPVYDAHLTVTATFQASGTPVAGSPVATPAPRQFASYQCQYRNDCQDVNATFDQPGNYHFLVGITSAQGSASFPFTYQVQASSLDLGLITGNGLLVIVVVGAAYITRYWWINRFRRLLGKPPIQRKGKSEDEASSSS